MGFPDFIVCKSCADSEISSLMVFNPSMDAVINACVERCLFESARQFATDYEWLTGHKHHLWERIIAGLVEQDEIERYGGE